MNNNQIFHDDSDGLFKVKLNSDEKSGQVKAINYNQIFYDDFHELFKEQLRADENFGVELWSALANIIWFHESDTKKTECSYSFRCAGSLIAAMLCKGDHMNWYCSGDTGVVSEYIAIAMASKGWKYIVYSNTGR